MSGTSTARAMAMRWSTALVEPPTAIMRTIAFSNAARVMMSRGLRSSSSRLRIGGAGGAAFLQLVGMLGGDAAAVGERHAEGFDGRGHGVGGVHAAAGAGAGAGVADDVLALLLGDAAGEEFAVALEGGDDVAFFGSPDRDHRSRLYARS